MGWLQQPTRILQRVTEKQSPQKHAKEMRRCQRNQRLSGEHTGRTHQDTHGSYQSPVALSKTLGFKPQEPTFLLSGEKKHPFLIFWRSPQEPLTRADYWLKHSSNLREVPHFPPRERETSLSNLPLDIQLYSHNIENKREFVHETSANWAHIWGVK